MNYILNENAKKLCEENHNLIYTCAYKHHLEIDEYYDMLAIGLCKAAARYNNEENFSTLAFACMENELKMYYRLQNKKSCIPSNICMSIYSEQPDNEGIELIDTIPEDTNSIDSILLKVDLSILFNVLSEKEKNIINLLMAGYGIRATAQKLGCSNSTIYGVQNKAKEILCTPY